MEETKTIKKGYKTVTFWMTILLSLSSVVTSLAGYIPTKLALIITVILTCLYNLLRAIQNAQIEGVTVWYKSTRLWSGALAILLAAFVSIRDGGISAPWVGSVIGVLTAVIAAAQAIGAQQPKTDLPSPDSPSKAS